jgi:hypothetical protein
MYSTSYSNHILMRLSFSTDLGKIHKHLISRISVSWDPSGSMRTETHRQKRTEGQTADNCEEANSCFSLFCERAYKILRQSSVPRAVF